MFAYDYPLLGVFWTTLVIFLWIAWFFLLFKVIADIFSNHKMGGVVKALWCIFVIVLPWLGVLLYLIVNGAEMGRRDVARAEAQEARFQAYVRETAGVSGPADQLQKLADLRDRGVLTPEEFEAQKAKLLA